MTKYVAYSIIDGKPRRIIVDENGNIVKRNPLKEEFRCLEVEKRKKKTGPKSHSHYTCSRIKEDGRICGEQLVTGNAYREKDKDGKETGRWICRKHYSRDYEKYNSNSISNIMKSMRNRRICNQDPNHSNTKGDEFQELACEEFGWTDLNKKYDNYKTPVDCYDQKTGLYHQVRGRLYNPIESYWSFAPFELELGKIYENMVCFCISEDGKIVERIYIFPKKEIDIRKSVAIVKYNSTGQLYEYGWYEQYRVTDEDELKKANKIWKRIIAKRQK